MNKKHELFEILKEVKRGNKMAGEAYDEILLLFNSEKLKCEHKGSRTATELVEYCEDCKKILYHP